MILAGIDPGLLGAVALLDAGGAVLDVLDMPVHRLSCGGKVKHEIDPHALAAMLGRDRIGHAFVERLGDANYGIVLGVLAALGIPTTAVPSRRWKASGARGRASQLLPAAAHHWPLVEHDGRAQAALIGLYGLGSLERIVA